MCTDYVAHRGPWHVLRFEELSVTTDNGASLFGQSQNNRTATGHTRFLWTQAGTRPFTALAREA